MHTALIYLGLILGIFIFVLPASQGSPLPEEFFELSAAMNSPVTYKLTILFDVFIWLAQIGFYVLFSILFIDRAPIRSIFITICGICLIIGFAGACFRLAGTSELASNYLNADIIQQSIITKTYEDLLRLINILFSAGGVLGGIALILTSSVAWSQKEFYRWSAVLIAISGILAFVKSLGELITGKDLGPVSLFAGVLFIIALISISFKNWSNIKVEEI